MTEPVHAPDSKSASDAAAVSGLAEEIELAILHLAAACPPGRTLAPMDVAQAVAPGENWQHVLPEIRRSAVRMAQEGRLLIYRKGKPVDPADLRGVYRLGLPKSD